MNAQAIVCPHCNARRADVPSGAAGKNLSPAEIRAMLALQLAPPAPSGGMMALILPHPSTTGTARTVELLLTVISLPLILSGALALVFSRRNRRRVNEGSGEAVAVTLMITLGSGILWTGLDWGLHASGKTVAYTLLVTITALIVRAVIRSRASARGLD